jgi:hypothetical protein
MTVQQVAPVVCSTCNAQFTAPIQNIIDGQDSAMKAAFLQGQVNLVQCPQCGSGMMPTIPILYYDLEKELAFVFGPATLNLSGPDQEKVVGQLTNSLVDKLPPEQRKFYLLNPKRFLTLDSMVKAILEADGITEEVMEAQAARVKLLEEFLQTPNEAALKEKVKLHDTELDYEFFEMLTLYMQTTQLGGDQVRAQTFLALRTILAQLSSNGKSHVAEIDAKLGIVVLENQEELLEKLRNAKNDHELEALIAAGHAMLDYGFFQKLTAKIDQSTRNGDSKKAAALKELRSTILELKAKHEEQGRIAVEKATKLLKEILQADRPDKVIEEKIDQIDQSFFFVLGENINEARRQGQNEPAQALEMIGNMAMTKLQEGGASQSQTGQPEAEPQILISK